MNFDPLPKFFLPHILGLAPRFAPSVFSPRNSPGSIQEAMSQNNTIKVTWGYVAMAKPPCFWWVFHGFCQNLTHEKWGSQNQHSWSQTIFFTLSVDLFRSSQMQQSGTQESLNWHQGHPEIHVECWHLKTTWTKRRDLTKHRDTTHAICLHNFGAGNPKLDVWVWFLEPSVDAFPCTHHIII